jgi:hypothetical protein
MCIFSLQELVTSEEQVSDTLQVTRRYKYWLHQKNKLKIHQKSKTRTTTARGTEERKRNNSTY